MLFYIDVGHEKSKKFKFVYKLYLWNILFWVWLAHIIWWVYPRRINILLSTNEIDLK